MTRLAPVETARLRLRELTLDDAGFIFELVNEPAFVTSIGDKNVRDLDGARRYLRNGPLASYVQHGHGLWHLSRRDDSEAVGLCGLLRREGLDDPDLGYAILSRHWGQGYAAEAAAACLGLGRQQFGLHRIVAITTPDNTASQRVLEKLGLRYERRIALPGMTGESALYGPERPA